MEDPISPRERAELAAAVKVDEQYLYQCLTGKKDMKPKLAVRVERVSRGRLRRWQLRRSDWFETWPELIGAEGAPAVPGEVSDLLWHGITVAAAPAYCTSSQTIEERV